MQVVVVLGASNDPSRYSYKAVQMLKEFNHIPIPVHPKETEILGQKVFKDLAQVRASHQKVDTLTVYLRPELALPLKDAIVSLGPRRVIFNPGTENPTLEEALKESGIFVEEACTLVLLRSGQF